MQDFIGNKKIIVIGLGQQGKKIVEFLLSKGWKNNIIGVCKTQKTKESIAKIYRIETSIDYKKSLKKSKGNIGFIFVGVVPLKTQEVIYQYLLKEYCHEKILIEKTFVSSKRLIESIQNKTYQHGIIRQELLSLPFFKKIPVYKNQVKMVSLLLQANRKIYKNILEKNVFLVSYMYDYISFLKPKYFRLLYQKGDFHSGYEFTFLINKTILLKLRLQELQKSNISNNTAIYYLTNGKKCIYNNMSAKSKIGENVIYNFITSHDYFHCFLEEKLSLLLKGEIKISTEIQSLLKFKKINDSIKIHF